MAVSNNQVRIVTRTAAMLRFRKEHPDHKDNGHARSLLKNRIAWQELSDEQQTEVEEMARKITVMVDGNENKITALLEEDVDVAIAYLEEPF